MIEHGGNLDKAISFYGGKESEWIDLSTGINPNSYPIPKLSISDWRSLPTKTEIKDLESIIKSKQKISSEIIMVPGAQMAINFLPFLLKGEGTEVRILTPTYNEYNYCFTNTGFKVNSCQKFNQLFNSDIAIIVNPNNPDGKIYEINELFELSKSVKILIVDESFIDSVECDSIVNQLNEDVSNIIVIRSFGKFFGLAGLRLGYVFSGKEIIRKFKRFFGPWQISKMSVKIATIAFSDDVWIKKTKNNLNEKANAIDNLMKKINWKITGGTNLFRLYSTSNSDLAQKLLAEKFIWSRKFSYSKKWIRLGIPNERDFKKLKKIVMRLQT